MNKSADFVILQIKDGLGEKKIIEFQIIGVTERAKVQLTSTSASTIQALLVEPCSRIGTIAGQLLVWDMQDESQIRLAQ